MRIVFRIVRYKREIRTLAAAEYFSGRQTDRQTLL